MLEFWDRPHADPTPLPMAVNPWPISIITASYLLFVLWLGPRFMAKRQPFNLRPVLKVYNILQVLYNAVAFLIITYVFFIRRSYNLICLPVLPMDHPFKTAERILCYSYYLNKVSDLLDTVFIVLRKSYKQISVLHLIHHVYMATACYVIIRLNGYGGHYMMTGYVNTFIHAVMYSYYLLISQRPALKKNLWWKQYITIMQMIQFGIIFTHTLMAYLDPTCDLSPYTAGLCMFMAILMFVMFSNFYIHAYILPKRSTPKKSS